jgi:hypothetical protein
MLRDMLVNGKGMSPTKLVRAGVFALMLIAGSGYSAGQHKKELAMPRRASDNPVFSSVPTELRSSLMSRLQLYLDSERRRDYGRLYDLLADETKHPRVLAGTSYESPLESKATYVRFRETSYPRLLAFSPISVREIRLAAYQIRGQATLRYKGGILKQQRILYASRQNGNWYFSDLIEEIIERYPKEEPIPTPSP